MDLYQQNKNDKMIEQFFASFFINIFLLIKFLLEIFLLGFKKFASLATSNVAKFLSIKSSKKDKFISMLGIFVFLLGIVNIILALYYFSDLLDNDIKKNMLLENTNLAIKNSLNLLDLKIKYRTLINISYCLLGLKFLFYFLFLGFFSKILFLANEKIELARLKKWNEKFDKIGFFDNNKIFPKYLKTEEGKYTTKIYFESYIDIDNWKKSISKLQQIFNNDIEVKTDAENLIIKIITMPTKKLPNFISFDKKYLSFEDNKICIGLDLFSRPVYMNFNLFPHWLISGDTGSGKSTLLKMIYIGLKKQRKKLVLIDMKGTTLKLFKKYEDNPIVYDSIDSVLEIMKKIEIEHDKRLSLFKELDDVENLEQFNLKTGKNKKEIFILIDEIARITVDQKNDEKTKIIIDILKKLAQLGRSQGIFLIFITQRPDADTLNPKIRACLGGKISGPFKDLNTSEMAINDRTAFKNFPEIKGRLLILQETTKQFQSFFIDNSALDSILLNQVQNTEEKK